VISTILSTVYVLSSSIGTTTLGGFWPAYHIDMYMS